MEHPLRLRKKLRDGMRYKGVSKSNRSGNAEKKGAKGLKHPIGLSGRTLGKLIQSYRVPNKQGGH